MKIKFFLIIAVLAAMILCLDARVTGEAQDTQSLIAQIRTHKQAQVLTAGSFTADFKGGGHTVSVVTVGKGHVDVNATGPHPAGTIATLTPKADPGGSFVSWSGADVPSGHENDVSLNILTDSDKTITANFIVNNPPLNVQYADWLFLMGGPMPNSPTDPSVYRAYIDNVIQGILKTKIRVVILLSTLWDWNRSGTLLTEDQVRYLVGSFKANEIAVGYHSIAPYPTEPDTCSKWLAAAAAELISLNAKIVYIDGTYNVPSGGTYNPDSADEWVYKNTMRRVVGSNGIVIGSGIANGCDGEGATDQGAPSNTWYFSHPREYADWRIRELNKDRQTMPKTLRFDLGWIGEYIPWYNSASPVMPWPAEDYRYVWQRAYEQNLPLTYRTTMELLVRPDNRSILNLIGSMEAARQPAGHGDKRWSSVAMSSDGTRIIAAAYGGRVYTSADSGATWVERQPAGNIDTRWSSVAMSSDGSKMMASVYFGGLYTSADYGATWIKRQKMGVVGDNSWISLAMSSDGKSMLAAYEGLIVKSSNSGADWVQMNPSPRTAKSWYSVALSSNGMTLAAVSQDGVYTSQNYGITWTLVKKTNTAESPNAGWNRLAMSSDGTKIIVVGWPGRLYISYDSGVTWIEKQPAGNNNMFWQSVSMSSDGTSMVAGVWPGRLYNSTDSGRTWKELQPAGNTDKYWESAAMSLDGTKLIVTDGTRLLFNHNTNEWSEPRSFGR